MTARAMASAFVIPTASCTGTASGWDFSKSSTVTYSAVVRTSRSVSIGRAYTSPAAGFYQHLHCVALTTYHPAPTPHHTT